MVLDAVTAAKVLSSTDATSSQRNGTNADEIASLGGTTAPDARKFLGAPDVVLAGPTDPAYDTILVGSGDREQPFDTTITNRFYMIKDSRTKT